MVKPPVRKVTGAERGAGQPGVVGVATLTFFFLPSCPQVVHEKEIQAEDDQVFLVKLQVSPCGFSLVGSSLLNGSWWVCWVLIGALLLLLLILCSHWQSLLAKQPAVTAGRPVVSVAQFSSCF